MPDRARAGAAPFAIPSAAELHVDQVKVGSNGPFREPHLSPGCVAAESLVGTLTSEPWRIGDLSIQPRRSAARILNRRKSIFAATVCQHRCAVSPFTSLTAAPCLCRSTPRMSFLMPLVLAFLLRGQSRNHSSKSARRGKKDGVFSGIGQHRQHRLGQSKDAGRILKTASSTGDLKSHSAVALLGHEINAIGSLHQIDLQ